MINFLVIAPEYSDGTTFGRFTNGKNYVDYLAESLNPTMKPSPSILRGSNYAFGGARTDATSRGPFDIWLSLQEQRDTYFDDVGSAGIDPGALHVVYGGANDVLDIIKNPFISEVEAITAGNTAVSNISDTLGSLAAANAKSILMTNLPNLGLVPLVTGGGDMVPEATALSVLFNTGLSNAVERVRKPILALKYLNSMFSICLPTSITIHRVLALAM